MLRIFVDIAAPATVLEALKVGVGEHELLFPATKAASVLEKAASDPLLLTADVAFGQPDPESIAFARRLQWIQISSSSISRYDDQSFRDLVKERGVVVCNSASVYAEACAEHLLAFMLAQSRQLPLGLRTRVAPGTRTWHALRAASIPLRGQTVLILGYGAIGKRLVELLRPFEMTVLAYRRTPRGDEGVPVVPASQLAEVLSRGVDHVVDILPDSAQTRHFFDSARFATFRPGASIFYNIGRGATVDQVALTDALRSGRVRAAWLDVTDPEPLADDHPLWREPNCFVTPHVAGGHLDEAMTLVRHFLNNLDRFVRGEPLLDRVM